MQPGTDRILTTHSGSLPRPAELLPLVLAQEAGQPVDEARFRSEVRAAVRDTVQRQADAGVDVLNDGEVSKPSYATYVKDRLTGFGGEGSVEQVAASVMGLQDFPDFAEKMAQTMAYGDDDQVHDLRRAGHVCRAAPRCRPILRT